jgi:hypothetical protein
MGRETQWTFLPPLAALVLGGVLSLAGSGCGDDACEAAYDKMMQCVDGLSCNRLGPTERQECEATLSEWNQWKDDRSLFLTACSQDSSLNTEAEKIAGCALNPTTCSCPP